MLFKQVISYGDVKWRIGKGVDISKGVISLMRACHQRGLPGLDYFTGLLNILQRKLV